MSKLLTVAWRELLRHLQKPGFYLVTLGLPLFFAAVVLLLGPPTNSFGDLSLPLIGPTTEPASPPLIGFVDNSGTISDPAPDLSQPDAQPYAGEQQGLEALRSAEIEVLFVMPADYRASGAITYYTLDDQPLPDGALQSFRLLLLKNLLPEADPRLTLRLEDPMLLRTVALSPAARVRGGDEESIRAAALLPVGFALLLSLSIFSSSSILLQALLEEKENRTIEVMMSSLSPQQFLSGKVLGLGLLGLLQLVTWMGLSQLLLGAGAGLLSSLRSINLPPSIWLLALTYFLLGYLLFASLMAGIGAISPSTRETSQLAILVSAPAAAPVLLLMPIVAEPNGSLAVLLSLFPLTSPMAMLVRQSIAIVPLWHVALSLTLLLAAVGVALWLASRLFRASTLLAGKRLSLREVARALRG